MGTTGTIAARYLAELTERRRVTIYNEVLERRVRERTEELRETQLEVVRRLAQAAESRDGDTGAHIERMSLLCERLAAPDRLVASRTPSCCATPPRCTTSARSASPTACSSSRASSTPRSARS